MPTDAALSDAGAEAGAEAGVVAGCGGLGAASTALTLGPAGSGSLTSALAFAGGQVAAVWEDLGGSGQVWLARAEPDGTLRGAASVIAQSAVSPGAVADGQQIAVVYHDRVARAIVLKRFDLAGKELGKRSLVASLEASAGYPKLAQRGDRYAIAYFNGSDATGFTAYLGLFAADGATLRDFAPLASSTKSTALVDVVATASGYAAAWTDERQGDRRVYAARFDAGGAKLPAGDLALSDGGNDVFPTLASQQDHLEVCYSADYDAGTNPEIECVHVDPANVVDPPLRVTSASGVSSFPKTSWSGARFLVTWGDEGFGLGKILLRQLDLRGKPDGSNVTLTNFTATSGYPSLAWLGSAIGLGWFQYSKGSWSYVYQSYACR